MVSLCLGFATISWAQSKKDKPVEYTLPTENIAGGTTKPANRPAGRTLPSTQRSASRPAAVGSTPPSTPQNDRDELISWIRWIQLGSAGFVPQESILIDLIKLNKRYPNDHTLAFYRASLNFKLGHTQELKTFCASNASAPNGFIYKPYCKAFQKGRITTFRRLPPSLAREWLQQLYPSYKKSPNNRMLRFQLIALLMRNIYRNKQNQGLVKKLLEDDLQAHPNTMWSLLNPLTFRVRMNRRNRTKLPFLLVEVQQFAQKYPHHLAPQLLLMRLAHMMRVRPLQAKVRANIARLNKGNSLRSFFIRYNLLMQSRGSKSKKLTQLQQEIAKFKTTRFENLEVLSLCKTVGRLAWRQRRLAQRIYDDLLKRFPNHPRVLMDAASNLNRLHRKKEARALFLKAATRVEDLHTLRLLYWRVQGYRTRPLALKVLTMYLKKHPGNAWALSKRANTYKLMGKKNEAEQDYRILLEKKTEPSAAIYRDIANFYRFDGNLRKAAAILNRAIQVYPKSAILYSVRAPIIKRMGKRQEAERDYLKAYQLNPTSYWAGNAYTRHLQSTQQYAKALTFVKKQLNSTTISRYYQKRWKSLYISTLIKAGKHKEAQAYVMQSGDATSLLNAARASQRTGKKNQALQYLRAALNKKSRKYVTRSIYRLMARIYTSQRKYKMAEKTYLQIIRNEPKQYYNYYGLSRLYSYRMKQPQKAIALWSAYIMQNPKDSKAYYQRARIHQSAKELQAALLDYKKGLQLSKKTRYHYSRVSSFIKYYLKKPALALDLWAKYLAKHPKDAYAYRERASLYAKMKNYKKAEQDYKRAIKLKPQYLYNYSALASMYRYRLRQPQKAIDLWTSYISKYPKKPGAYRNRAYLYRQQKAYQQAVADYETAIKLQPHNAYSYSSLASLYTYYLKDFDKAAATWTRYIHRKKYDASGYINRAKIYARQKSWDKALTDWNAAARRVSRKWRRYRVYLGRAKVYQALKQYNAAITDLRMAYKTTTSTYARRRINKSLIACLEAKGDMRGALKILNQTKFSRWDRSPKFTKLRLLVGLGQLEKALSQALSYCKGPERFRSRYYRRRACRQHAWLQYTMRLFQLPVTSQAFDNLPERPGRHSRKGGKSFQKILKLLLRSATKRSRFHKKKKKPTPPAPARPRNQPLPR